MTTANTRERESAATSTTADRREREREKRDSERECCYYYTRGREMELVRNHGKRVRWETQPGSSAESYLSGAMMLRAVSDLI